jgi:O-antigen ligase
VHFLINGTGKRVVIISAATTVLILAVWGELTFHLISEHILNMYDPRRGIESGFTGRFEPWVYGLQLAMEKPFFGYGYRASEALFDPLGASSVHNGYLSMLLDTGVIGLISWITFLWHTTRIALRRLRRQLAVCSIGFIVAYIVLGMVERYALNAGQPTSILFLIAAFYMIRPMTGAVLRRGGESYMPAFPTQS